MKRRSLIAAVALTALVLGLSACSSTSSWFGGKKDTAVGDAGGAYSSGVGARSSFSGESVDSAFSRVNAPEDQTYYFSYDSSRVAQNNLAAISTQARYLLSHPKARILLAGNTDERGSREYNVALGERRAMSVADLMRLDGVSNEQIRIVSYGEEKPVAMGHDESAYRLNRRVELTFEAK